MSEQLFYELFLIFTLLFPVVYVMAIGSNLYSGLRQMLFVIPVMVILASVGIFALARSKKKLRIPAMLVVGVLMLLPFKHQASTFPADYVYFNSISGGNRHAWSNYEYDYYFHGMREATAYLLDKIGDEKALVAMNTQLPNYFEKSENVDFKYTRYLERSSHDWDYALFGVNYIHPYMLKNNTWQSARTVKTFYHKGNPLVVLLERGTKDDLSGIRAINNKDWESGEELLKNELKQDPNNVWLYVNLANMKLAQKDFTAFDTFLEKGRAIHPLYEPFYLLEAQKLYDQGNYEAALEALNELIEVNPRYRNAGLLLKKVRGKLNMN